MGQLTRPPILGANDLEREIEEDFRNRPPFRLFEVALNFLVGLGCNL